MALLSSQWPKGVKRGSKKGVKMGPKGVILGVSRVKVGLKAGFEEMAQKGSKTTPKWPFLGGFGGFIEEMALKPTFSPIWPKMTPKMTQNDPFWDPFLTPFEPSWPFPLIKPLLNGDYCQKGSKRGSKRGSKMTPFWTPFWTLRRKGAGRSEAKRGPKRVILDPPKPGFWPLFGTSGKKGQITYEDLPYFWPRPILSHFGVKSPNRF